MYFLSAVAETQYLILQDSKTLQHNAFQHCDRKKMSSGHITAWAV